MESSFFILFDFLLCTISETTYNTRHSTPNSILHLCYTYRAHNTNSCTSPRKITEPVSDPHPPPDDNPYPDNDITTLIQGRNFWMFRDRVKPYKTRSGEHVYCALHLHNRWLSNCHCHNFHDKLGLEKLETLWKFLKDNVVTRGRDLSFKYYYFCQI